MLGLQYQKPAAAASGYGGAAAGAASSYGSRNQTSGYGQQPSGSVGSYGANAATPAASAYPAKVGNLVTVALHTLCLLTLWSVIDHASHAGHVCQARFMGQGYARHSMAGTSKGLHVDAGRVAARGARPFFL